MLQLLQAMYVLWILILIIGYSVLPGIFFIVSQLRKNTEGLLTSYGFCA